MENENMEFGNEMEFDNTEFSGFESNVPDIDVEGIINTILDF